VLLDGGDGGRSNDALILFNNCSNRSYWELLGLRYWPFVLHNFSKLSCGLKTQRVDFRRVVSSKCGRWSDFARMNVEEKRLRTFREWPANAAIDPARLAKAGFYYTGHVLEVQCFLCGTRISDWNYGDQAIVRHRQKSPNCPFVLAPTVTCNVPLIPATADNVTAESTAHCQLGTLHYSVYFMI